MRLYFPLLALAALLTNNSVSANSEVDFSVDTIYNTRRYDLSASITKDNRLTIIFSTTTSRVDTLAAVGPERNLNLSLQDGYGTVRFHNRANISEIQFGEWDIKGTLALDAGMTAMIAGNVWWDFDVSYTRSYDKIRKLAPIAEISGPTTSPYAKKFNSTRPAEIESSYCSGWDQIGRTTFQISGLNFDFEIHIVKSEGAAPEAKGSVGEKSPIALQLSTELLITEGCSRNASMKTCSKDRTGYELCTNEFWQS